MLDFEVRTLADGSKELHTSISGKPLLTTPQLNKGTAFTAQERIDFELLGKLPMRIESLNEQLQRAYKQFRSFETKLQQHIYLNSLQNKNEVLFYHLLSQHLDEMMPVIYTPIVGNAVKEFSAEYREARGLYIAYPEMDDMERILDNRSNPDIDLIVVTDGEGVLGIGDQGVGGMDIPIAKLMVYTLCGGINPARTLPILLDVGTNNQELLDNPMYLGWHNKRIQGKDYDEFIGKFVDAVHKKFPNIFLHWEDFGRDNARRNLDRYRDKICTFNDDMQGTGVVTLAAILAAVKANHDKLSEQRIVVFGAGTAGTGISDQILEAMQREGIDKNTAYQQFWLIDKHGLLLENTPQLTPEQTPYAHSKQDVNHWECANPDFIQLQEVINNVKPTILIGCSSVHGAFTEEVISTMAKHVARPVILPLSNPTEHAEAEPKDILAWSQGRALVASGSPFGTVEYAGQQVRISQCNNAFVFPGIGLGIIAIGAKRLTENMLWAACDALVNCSPIINDSEEALLPVLGEAQHVAKRIAVAVAKQAIDDGVADSTDEETIHAKVEETFWRPEYLPFKRK